MFITNDIFYVGVNDHQVDLFEGQYVVPNGMAYNSYVIKDEKIVVIDTVDQHFTKEWLGNVANVLDGKKPDYLLIHHMEPDHAANIDEFMKVYTDTTIVSSSKAFAMMKNFFGTQYDDRRIIVKEGDTLALGEHTLAFVEAPMVHWPEVIVSYDVKDKVLFSADGFGKFGALDVEEDWDDESRRYFIGIVGKYGKQVQNLLKKAATLDIAMVCPTHGPVLKENLGHYINKYDIWSSYGVEDEGIVVAYTSVYGHTKVAAEKFAQMLKDKGCPAVAVYDLARDDMSKAVADAFRYGRLVLATTTYNADIFPPMKDFINHLTERNYQNRKLALIENGSWAPCAAKVMKKMFEECKDLEYASTVTIMSALNEESEAKLEALADELCMDYAAQKADAPKNDLSALFKIGYGLYVVTSNDGEKHNGLIVNTVTQLTSEPNRVAVNINKANYSHDVIKKTGIMNVNVLSEKATFKTFQKYGFCSGKDTDKFAGDTVITSDNGLVFLTKEVNSFMSLKVEDYVDFGTHGMFICSVTESRVLSKDKTMSYDYYFANVKPQPQTDGVKGFVCNVCGWIYEGDELPADIICPLCKHGAADFERIG